MEDIFIWNINEIQEPQHIIISDMQDPEVINFNEEDNNFNQEDYLKFGDSSYRISEQSIIIESKKSENNMINDIEAPIQPNNPKLLKKAAYNFGKTAIKGYFIGLIKKGFYDAYIEKIFKKTKEFIKSFKNFCSKVSYQIIRDFKEIWRYNTFIGSDFNDFRVLLTKLTKKFLQDDVFQWIQEKTKKIDYVPIYKKCVIAYLKGIDDIDSFDIFY